MKQTAIRVSLIGLLGALAVALSFLEGLLPPLPLTPPGFRLGLSNLVCMLASQLFGVPTALFLAVLKGGFAFLTRGVSAGLMSLSGAVLSTVCSGLLLRKARISYRLVGICGALAHNTAQLACAWLLTSKAVLWYAPVLVLLSLLSGLLTGILLQLLLPVLPQLPVKHHQ